MKNELIIGGILSMLVLFLTMFYTTNYKSLTQKSNALVTPSVNNNVILTTQEVEKHNTPSDCWMIVNNKVYQVTQYAALHPGGTAAITDYCGKDATEPFLTKGGRGSHSSRADQQHTFLLLGNLGEKIQNQPDINKISLPVNNGNDDN